MYIYIYRERVRESNTVYHCSQECGITDLVSFPCNPAKPEISCHIFNNCKIVRRQLISIMIQTTFHPPLLSYCNLWEITASIEHKINYSCDGP